MKEKDDDVLCSPCFDIAEAFKNSKCKKINCSKCGKECARTSSHGGVCLACYGYFSKHGRYERVGNKPKEPKPSIDQKEVWINKKAHAKPALGITEKIERSRVFKKNSYNHYCAGRRWDFI